MRRGGAAAGLAAALVALAMIQMWIDWNQSDALEFEKGEPGAEASHSSGVPADVPGFLLGMSRSRRL